MALVNPCNLAATSSNTGAECNNALKASAQIWLVPKTAFWQTADLADFTAFLNTKIHATAASRFYPIFGNSAPIRIITDNPAADVIEELEDGSVQFIRYGMYNRTFLTTEGGMDLARHLMGLSQNYAFIETDIIGQVGMMKNADGTYSGFPTNLAYPPAPMLANLKTSYKNQFMLSFSPNNYIKKGYVFSSDADEDILSLRGLYDTEVTQGSGVNSITKIYVDVTTIAGGTDLVALYGATLAAVGNFVLTNANGTPNTPSAAAVVNGEVEFTGTFATGTNITVGLAAPSVLKAAGIVGYEGTKTLAAAIP